MTYDQVLVWTALVTPFFEDGRIDFDSMDRLIEQQQAAQNGILLLGSTGEALALTDQERREVLTHVRDRFPQVPLMVGVGGFQLQSQIEWVHFVDSVGVDALLLVTPIYAKPGPQGQCAWFDALLSATRTPCMLYNIPSRAGAVLHPTVLSACARHPHLWALKDSGSDVTQTRQYQQANNQIRIFCGNDDEMTEFANLGAVGCVSVVSHLWPQALHDYLEALLAGQSGERELWQRRGRAVGQYGNPVTIKTALHHAGLIETAYCRPPLATDDVATLPRDITL